MMRNAQWASLHSAMGMGRPPWSFGDPHVSKVMLDSALLHERLHAYFYSQAVRWFHNGYPWTMAPLPLAYPRDKNIYGRENEKVRGYEWMIGDALLAAPLYGNDYATANSRDVYLPDGRWMDYDSGKSYEGNRFLRNFLLPPGKTPLFVGGTGVIVEREPSGLQCRLFPVTNRSSTEFWDRDGRTVSHIHLDVRNWEHIHVVNLRTKVPVKGAWNRNAFQFMLQPGEDYKVG